MPSGFDPRCPYDLSLFEDVPAEECPVFTFRRLNSAEFVQLSKAFECNAATVEEYQSEIFGYFKIGLLGWERQYDPSNNEEVPYDQDSLGRIINAQEALALIDKRLDRGRLNRTEKKTSELPA